MTEKTSPSRRGRPPKNPEFGAMSPAQRQAEYRHRKKYKDLKLAHAVRSLVWEVAKFSRDHNNLLNLEEIDTIEEFLSSQLGDENSSHKTLIQTIKDQCSEIRNSN